MSDEHKSLKQVFLQLAQKPDDSKALSDLYELLESRLRYVLASFPGQVASERDEIVQRTVVRIHNTAKNESLAALRNPDRYVDAILKNQAIDYFRKARTQDSLKNRLKHEPSLQDNEEIRFDSDMISDALKVAIDSLDSEDKHLFEACYVTGKSITELSEAAKTSYSAMGVRLHRIRRKLQAKLQAILYSDS